MLEGSPALEEDKSWWDILQWQRKSQSGTKMSECSLMVTGWWSWFQGGEQVMGRLKVLGGKRQHSPIHCQYCTLRD